MARPTLFQNVKLKALARRLKLPTPYAIGLLEMMWHVGYESGNPTLGAPNDVEAAAEWPGEAGVFFCAARDLRLIDETPDGRWAIHDFWDHAPDYVQNRAQREAARKKEKECAHCGGAYRSSDCRSKYCSPACRTGAWRCRDGCVKDGNVTVTDSNVTVTECDGTPNTQHPSPNTHHPSSSPSGKEEGSPAVPGKVSRARAFVKPTLDEVAAYCRERNNSVDASAFLDHYEANGWRVGKTPMKDWKAAVRTWERNDRHYSSKPNSRSNHDTRHERTKYRYRDRGEHPANPAQDTAPF